MENNPEYIDAYFNNELAPEEASQFEQKINDDRNFAVEVAFYLSAKQVSMEEMMSEKKKWFRELADQNVSQSKSPEAGNLRKIRLYRVAAAAAIIGFIFFAGYLFLSKPHSPQQLADKYIRAELQTLGVRMGVENNSIQDGVSLYNENRLDSSLKLFEGIIQRDSDNILAKEYAGIVYLRLSNYDKALAYFQQLEKITLVSNPATFYHALTLMKRNHPGDKQTARQLLQRIVDNDLAVKETAQQWLAKKW